MLKIRIKKDKQKRKKKPNFNLAEVILIMIVTVVCTIILTIRVSYEVNNTPQKLKTKTELSEFINVYDSIANDYYKEINKDEMISSAIEAMLDYLDDPYSSYLDKEQAAALNQQLNGEYEGIGAKIKLSNKQFSVNEIFKDGPAEKSGLKKDDIILKIDDISLEGKTLNEVSNIIKSKGKKSFIITVNRKKEKLDITIKRSMVDLKSVDYRTIKRGKEQIGIVNINVFAKNTFVQFKEIIDKINLNEISSLIVDLRNNQGGYLTTATSVAEMFLNKNDVIYQISTKKATKKIVNKKERVINTKVVVLVNGSSASAAEILAASFKENLNAEIVGEKTYGKGKVQKTKTLSDGSIVKFTIESWLTPNGDKIDQKGIKPTVEVALDKKYYKKPTDENDAQLQKAIEIALEVEK